MLLIDMARYLFAFLVWCYCNLAVAYGDLDLQFDMESCGSAVHIETLKPLIKTESQLNPLAIADAGPVDMPWRLRKKMVKSYYPDTLESALQIAEELLRQGHTISIGLTQINDRNLPLMGLTLEQAFDPCTNIKHGSKLLAEYYVAAFKKFGNVSKALDAALSKYNSGSYERGRDDGYVDLIYKNAGLKQAVKISEKTTIIKNTKSSGRELALGTVNYE